VILTSGMMLFPGVFTIEGIARSLLK